jgi:hypothetical protein
MLSPEDIESSLYKDIYSKNLPDKIIEFFWYGFKESIQNMVNSIEDRTIKSKVKGIFNNLNETANKLNQLQIEEKYDEIKEIIENYIVILSRIFFLPYANNYNFNIYLTNLKRWETWVLELPEKKRHTYEWLKSTEQKDDYFLTFFRLRKYICDHSNRNDSKEEMEFINNLEAKLQDYRYNSTLISPLSSSSSTSSTSSSTASSSSSTPSSSPASSPFNSRSKAILITSTSTSTLLSDPTSTPEYPYHIKNKLILEEIYRMIILERYFRPTILIELSNHYPVLEDLKRIGYIKSDIPDKWLLEKAIKKGINPNFK